MDKRWLILIAVGVLIALSMLKSNRTDVMRYRGEAIKLSKSYADFDQYKNDPNNIDSSETSRVQTLVATAPIAQTFTSRESLFKATQDIVFPGYMSGVIPGGPQPDGDELFAVPIEIPRAKRNRFIVFRGHNGQYRVIDDFVPDDNSLPWSLRQEGGSYVFFDRAGRELFRRSATQPSAD
jgi:hypothetical protein